MERPRARSFPPLSDRSFIALGEPLASYLADERLQRQLLGDCSYSVESYAADPWSAWEAGGCYTLAAALRPLLAPVGRLVGVSVRYAEGDRRGELEHVGIAIAGGFLDARGLRGFDAVAAAWAEIAGVAPRSLRIVPILLAEERERYQGLPGSEPSRITALRTLLASDLAASLRALRESAGAVGHPSRA